MSTMDLTNNSHSEDSGVTDMSTSTEKVGELLMFKFDSKSITKITNRPRIPCRKSID